MPFAVAPLFAHWSSAVSRVPCYAQSWPSSGPRFPEQREVRNRSHDLLGLRTHAQCLGGVLPGTTLGQLRHFLIYALRAMMFLDVQRVRLMVALSAAGG